MVTQDKGDSLARTDHVVNQGIPVKPAKKVLPLKVSKVNAVNVVLMENEAKMVS